PFQVQGRNVLHVPEEERRGVIRAVNAAYANTSAEYIAVWSDDASPDFQCLGKMLDFLKTKNGPVIGSFRKRNANGKELEQWSVYGRLYGSWLCASRQTLDAVGGLFDPGYKNFWADPDLSLRVWTNNGTVEVCRDAWILVEQIVDQVKADNLSSSFEDDTNFFLNRWNAHFVGTAKPAWNEINRPVPHSFGGHIRSALRQIRCLRQMKNAAQTLIRRST